MARKRNIKIDKALALTQQLAIQRYAKSAERFICELVHIEDKDSETGIARFELWPGQKEALKAFLENRLVIVLKARQLGLTWLALSYATWRLLFNPGYTVVGLSRRDEDAKELVRRMTLILKYLPRWLVRRRKEMPNASITWDSTAHEVVIYHKDKEPSRFIAMPAAPDSGRSFTANLVIIDEWAFQQWAREIWTAAYPTINRPTGGQVIGLSTAKRGTLFEEIWDKAKEGENDFYPVFLPWDTDPRRDQEWYEKTQKALGKEAYQEYPATPEEAFLFSEESVFDTEKVLNRIKELKEKYKKNPPKVGDIECKYDSVGNPIRGTEKFVEKENGWLTIYEMPQKGVPYVIGGDIAEGGKDFSVLQVIRNTDGKQVATWRARTDTDIFTKQAFMLGHFYNTALLSIEVNFDSYPVKKLKELHYPKQYRREVVDSVSRRIQQRYGVKTTSATRPVMIANLVAIFRDNIELINDLQTLEEALTFVRNEDGKPEAPEGKHDDTILALAIAYYSRDQQSVKRRGEEKLVFSKDTPESEKEKIRTNILFEKEYEKLRQHRIAISGW